MTERIKELQSFLQGNEAILILSDVNRLYLTGFKSSAGAVVITKEEAILFIDFRYFEKAEKEVKHLRVVLSSKLYSQIGEYLKEKKINTLLAEEKSVTVAELKGLQKALDITVSAEGELSKKIEEMRSIKTDYEIGLIEKAQQLTDKAFNHILNFIRLGVTEKDIALELEFFMRKNGSEGVAFDFIAVSGENSSLPHGKPTEKKIENGDFITMDYGAVINGYRSDMTRTVAVGFVSDKQREAYSIVLEAQRAALSIIKPDVECFIVDKAARALIAEKGFGDNFGHGLGHSVGLEIHESPACNTRDKTRLKKGMIMTVEPGIYIPNEFGVRIEDMVVVTDNGYYNFTKSPKELIIL